jgi:hypothetical protein
MLIAKCLVRQEAIHGGGDLLGVVRIHRIHEQCRVTRDFRQEEPTAEGPEEFMCA